MVVRAGDYEYRFTRHSDGTYHATRAPIDNPSKRERLGYVNDLPGAVQEKFLDLMAERARNPIA